MQSSADSVCAYKPANVVAQNSNPHDTCRTVFELIQPGEVNKNEIWESINTYRPGDDSMIFHDSIGAETKNAANLHGNQPDRSACLQPLRCGGSPHEKQSQVGTPSTTSTIRS